MRPNAPRFPIVTSPTPLQRLDRLSDALDIDLYVKRDDVAGPPIGGNKSRQLEYYFGAARAKSANTILITGAVQSNFARLAASLAGPAGMKAIVQLESRVDRSDSTYATSGNVLLSALHGAEIMTYPEGEDEAGADAALFERAEQLAAHGNTPYVIPLSQAHPPLGALGYVDCAAEILSQDSGFDHVVVASGSAATHCGLLAGFKAHGSDARIIGSCVRRPKAAQFDRILGIIKRMCEIYPPASQIASAEIVLWDKALAPGYGQLGDSAREAIKTAARMEGLLLDPVYTAKSFAAVLEMSRSGEIPKGSKVCFVHTGGLAAVFAYGQDMLSETRSTSVAAHTPLERNI